DDLRPFGSAQPVHIDTMRERCANCMSQVGETEEESLVSGLSPAGERGLSGTRLSFLRGQLRRPRLATHETATTAEIDRGRVLGTWFRIGLALTSGEVHHGLGKLVRVSGHSGALRHGPSLRLLPSIRQTFGVSN